MKGLICNAGSTLFKFKFYDMPAGSVPWGDEDAGTNRVIRRAWALLEN